MRELPRTARGITSERFIIHPHSDGKAIAVIHGDALSPWSFAQTFSCPPKRSPSFTAEELHNLQILLMEQLERRSGLVIGTGSKKRRAVMDPDGKLRLEQFDE